MRQKSHPAIVNQHPEDCHFRTSKRIFLFNGPPPKISLIWRAFSKRQDPIHRHFSLRLPANENSFISRKLSRIRAKRRPTCHSGSRFEMSTGYCREHLLPQCAEIYESEVMVPASHPAASRPLLPVPREGECEC